MKTDSIVVTGVVPATADEVIAAYLDSDAHGAMTGAPAEVDPVVGGAMSAWGGYIEGVFVKLGADAIVQRWRADDFPAGSIDSRLEMRVTQAPKGARVTFAHSELPAGMGEGFARGWELYYLEPMQKFFRDLAETSRAPTPMSARAELELIQGQTPLQTSVWPSGQTRTGTLHTLNLQAAFLLSSQWMVQLAPALQFTG